MNSNTISSYLRVSRNELMDYLDEVDYNAHIDWPATPDVDSVELMISTGYCLAVGCGCEVEIDETCIHGNVSWPEYLADLDTW